MNIQLSIKSEQKSFIEIAREKVAFYGTEQASLADLFALIIGKSASEEACHLLSSLSVREIINLSEKEIKELGFSKSIAERIYACIQFAKKINAMNLPDSYVIRSPEDAANALMYLKNYEQETFVVLTLDSKNKITSKKEIFKGSLNSAIVHPREVFRHAIKKGAASIIVAHQHPSGDPSPTREDIEVSKRLAEVGRVTGIEVLDSLIIGDNKFVSLKEKGYI